MNTNDIKVSMADLINCWKESTGQDDGSSVLPREKSHEFFSYSKEHLDAMLDQIRKKREEEHHENMDG